MNGRIILVMAARKKKPERVPFWDWVSQSARQPRQVLGQDAHSAERLEKAFAERREQWKRDTEWTRKPCQP
jgi:hypothetical protein